MKDFSSVDRLGASHSDMEVNLEQLGEHEGRFLSDTEDAHTGDSHLSVAENLIKVGGVGYRPNIPHPND